ncbi:threonine--tRNA ligase [Cuniculiplasma sp. SKW3]|uniref:threonine--tRNA ligase n=1 Tax=Cuniculiplasma sp. SKW3 TaxID=3400170 RepID=UPI003FD344D0
MIEKTTTVRKGETFGSAFQKNKDIIAVVVNGTLHDLREKASEDSQVEGISINSEEGIRILRHSAAHLLAHAVTEIYKDAKPNAGPVIEDGFYYDIDMPPPSQEDLEKIEIKMKELAEMKIPIVREEHSREELLKIFSKNKYKIDKINENVEKSSTVYRQGNFVDFCRGPHVPDTSYIKHFKLLNVASTNYMGDIKREKLVRIYGTAFPDEKSLKAYLKNREEAVKRDHRKIGQEMDLFVFNSERAPGLPLYTAKGATIRNELINFMRELNTKFGWEEVCTPHLFKDTMWKISGHYYKYKDDMFLFTLPDGDSYALKPMNCPGHITIYENTPHSYRDLPVKISEFGTVYRYEKSGEVGGLTRPRTFTIDDGHEFMRPDQIQGEIEKVLEMMDITFKTFFDQIEIKYDLSVADKNKPENYLVSYKCKDCGMINEPKRVSGSDGELKCAFCGSSNMEPDFSLWDNATEQLRSALKSRNIEYKEYPGEAAFYGPKIDVHIKDAIGRSWQLTTIQIDFFMPITFGLYYINEESKKETPVMLHRAIYGSIERFLVILLENSYGKLPTWLSPIQVYVIPLSDQFKEYALKLERLLKENGIRTYLDDSQESVSKKIKLGRVYRPAYFVIVGEKEKINGEVSVRNRKDEIQNLKFDEFLDKIKNETRIRAKTEAL